jgi:tetratricopeptide (TPR) repeat protein
MKSYVMLRTGFVAVGVCLCVCLGFEGVRGQDVGAEVGGGAGIFRAKNPETKKRTTKPLTPVTKPGTNRPPSRSNRPSAANLEDRIEDLLDKGNTARDERRFADAEESYKGVLKLKPRDARGAYGLGNVYSDQQRWDEAEAAYRNAVQWAPTSPDAYVALSVLLVQPRSGADNAKRLADAETFARRSVQIDPKNPVGWDRLGVALQARNLLNSETEHSYRRAIELDPEFAVAYAHLARFLNRTNRSAEADPLYKKAFELAKNAPTLNLIAESLQAEQLWPASEPVLKRALELDSRSPRSNLLMGRYLAVYKRFDEAEPYLKTATEVSSRSFESFNLLGRVYLALGRLTDAEAAYERASTLAAAGEKKQLAGAFGFEGVGDGYMKVQQPDNAARAYQRALELDPGNSALQQKLSKARSR